MQQAHLGKSIKNDMWITEDEDERTPDVLPELPGFHVLVRPVSIKEKTKGGKQRPNTCLLYTSPSPRDRQKSRMPSSA